MTLTPRQREILALIRERIDDHGLPPTRAEIARAFGFRSANAAEQHLRALARKGVIELVPGASRGIRLAAEAGIPVIGRVAAGSPVLAAEHIERRLHLDPGMFKPRADYLLRVEGMSMRDAGILDGDLVAVHRTPEVRDGQVVVARVDGHEVTVKRYRRRANEVRLEADNPDHGPILLDLTERELAIEGFVVGVIRAGTPSP